MYTQEDYNEKRFHAILGKNYVRCKGEHISSAHMCLSMVCLSIIAKMFLMVCFDKMQKCSFTIACQLREGEVGGVCVQ